MVFLICFMLSLAAFISAHFLFLKSVVEDITQSRECPSRCRDPTVHNPFIYPLYRALGLVIFIRRKKKPGQKYHMRRLEMLHLLLLCPSAERKSYYADLRIRKSTPVKPSSAGWKSPFIGMNTYHHPVRCCIPRPRDLTRSTEMTKRRLNI